jgi:hypothetical protein
MAGYKPRHESWVPAEHSVMRGSLLCVTRSSISIFSFKTYSSVKPISYKFHQKGFKFIRENIALHFDLFFQDILITKANFLQISSKGIQVYKSEHCTKITNLSIIHTCKMILLLSRISYLPAALTSMTLGSMRANVPAYVISVRIDRNGFIHQNKVY